MLFSAMRTTIPTMTHPSVATVKGRASEVQTARTSNIGIFFLLNRRIEAPYITQYGLICRTRACAIPNSVRERGRCTLVYMGLRA
jgi:hypothetical protein